ncbi:hypothetical protein L6452_14002 [Arctium lappa]|uniref:Uncharacterized protein n=1 Tax=Arctium lappa TaxID=4217 RepID=A0ACB9CJV8_ARCLA|nr:hypothetical protein L6452_14002 [Arctium lappa]
MFSFELLSVDIHRTNGSGNEMDQWRWMRRISSLLPPNLNVNKWCVAKRIYGYKYNSKTPKLRGALRLCFSIVGGHSFCNEVAVKTLRLIDPWLILCCLSPAF